MATLLLGGAEGVLAQEPISGVIGSLGPFVVACGVAVARTLNTTPRTVELPRARARGLNYRKTPVAGCTLFWY